MVWDCWSADIAYNFFVAEPRSYVALLGDSAHSFPPDLGQVSTSILMLILRFDRGDQGVNSALLDVFELRDSIRYNPSNLTKGNYLCQKEIEKDWIRL